MPLILSTAGMALVDVEIADASVDIGRVVVVDVVVVVEGIDVVVSTISSSQLSAGAVPVFSLSASAVALT